MVYVGQPVGTWNAHVLTVLKRSRLIDRCASHKFTNDGDSVSLETDNQEWRISLGKFLDRRMATVVALLIVIYAETYRHLSV